jgi:nitrile hydratase accessory protein
LNQPDPSAGVPADPVFSEPWQASAFALTLSLHQRGLFDWSEWAATLADVIGEAEAAPVEYYQHWLTALERIVMRKQVATGSDIDALAAAWSRAAEATPHGMPIVLENDPMNTLALKAASPA